jgi:CubicO group peptidase (beta-lactamase class C family)
MIPEEPEALGLSSARLRRLSAALQRGVDKGEIPGAVMLVARHGKIAYFEPFGFRDREAAQPMRRDSIFRVASMTKPLASLAAMMLVEEGKLMLALPASHYLPELKDLKVAVEAPDGSLRLTEPRHEMTVLDLLRHTSGFTYEHLGDSAVKKLYRTSDVASTSAAITSAVFIAKLAALPLQFAPGSAWGYGVSTDVVGHIVEAVSGVSLDAFIATRITDPLRMPDTAYWVPEQKRHRLAEPQVDPSTGERPLMGDVARRPARFSGGCGMVSTAIDYARFCQFWLNGGDLDGVRLVSRKTVEFMTSNHLQPTIRYDADTAATFGSFLPSPDYGYGFGLGFAVRTHVGRNPAQGSVGEFYWVGSTGTSFWIDPREKLFAIFLVQASEQLVPFFCLTRALVYQALVD